MSKKVIAVDFDGVIHRYSQGWLDGRIYDKPVPGTAEALRALREKGWRVVIFTVRATCRVVRGSVEPDQLVEITQYLIKHNIPYDAIHTAPNKPIASVYLDDRAICFRGNWDAAVEEIENFKPWTNH